MTEHRRQHHEVKWTPTTSPRPTVRLRLVDGVHTIEGTVTSWSTLRLKVRFPIGLLEVSREDGEVIQRGNYKRPKLTPESLAAVNAHIHSVEAAERKEPTPVFAKSAHALVVWNAAGSIAIEGFGKLVRLQVPTGYEPEKVAADLESIIAWAERSAASSAVASRQGGAAGRASAARRKVVRTKRPVR
jgi:hypothetical protein